MRFIVAVLAFALAGSAGWAGFHFVVGFLFPGAGSYAAYLALVFYLLGFMPRLRHYLRSVLNGAVIFCLGYIFQLLFTHGADFLDLQLLFIATVYFFLLRYPVDRSLERGLTKVIAQFRSEAPGYLFFLGTSACVLIFSMCAVYIAYRYDQMSPHATGLLGLLPSASAIIMAIVVMFSACGVLAAIAGLLGLFIPRPDFQPRSTPKPQEIFTTGRPATLGQLDTAARGGASNVVPLRFKD